MMGKTEVMGSAQHVRRTGRRSFLAGAGGLVLAACSGDGGAAITPAAGFTADPLPNEALTVASFEDVAMCVLTPEGRTGPFPSPELIERRTIHEGFPGHPLRLGIRVVDGDWEPIPDAMVDIWHTDATGDYSAFEDGGSGKDEAEGSTFCRGMQVTDADGIVEFQSIYPGWYEGRVLHIHASVWIDDERVHTTQLYFDEAYTAAVFETGVYAEFGQPDTGWADDRIIGDPTTDGSGIALAAAETDDGLGTLGLVTLGADI